MANEMVIGAVTDYGPLTVHWMRHRRPYYQGGSRTEAERPSPSYIVNVSLPGF